MLSFLCVVFVCTVLLRLYFRATKFERACGWNTAKIFVTEAVVHVEDTIM